MKTTSKNALWAAGLIVLTPLLTALADEQSPDFGLEPRNANESSSRVKANSAVPDIKIQIDGKDLQLSGNQIETMVAEVLKNLANDNGKVAREMLADFLESQGGGEPLSIEHFLRQLPKVAGEGGGSFEIGGEPGIDFEAKAFVIGPDGEKREIEINADEIRRKWKLHRGGESEAETDTDAELERTAEGEMPLYYIGVAVEPAPEALLGHLGLAENTGVVVTQVFDGTPAAAAGLRAFDVIVKANGEAQGSHESLVKAVQDAGENALELTVIREQKAEEITVKPIKRELPNVTSGLFVPKFTEEIAEEVEALLDKTAAESEEGLEALRDEIHETHQLLEKILERLEKLESHE